MEDDTLKEIMKQSEYSTSADFTSKLMQRIEATSPAWQSEPLAKQRLPKTIAFIFAIICLVSIALSFFIKPIQLPLGNIPDWVKSSSQQIIYFLLIFWTVLLINRWYNKKKGLSYSI